MSYTYWNPADDKGKSFNDQLIYGQLYYDWTETKKYRSNQQFPTNSRGYPRLRSDIELRRPIDVYRNKDLLPNGAARVYKKFNTDDRGSLAYFKTVYPPTYYQMWN
jgi:hypothetical protein